MLCKITPRLSEIMIFKVLEDLEKHVLVMLLCLVSGLAWESFFMDFDSILGSILSPKIDEKRD